MSTLSFFFCVEPEFKAIDLNRERGPEEEREREEKVKKKQRQSKFAKETEANIIINS